MLTEWYVKVTHCPHISILVVEVMAQQVKQERSVEWIILDNNHRKLLQYADGTNGILTDIKSRKCFLSVVAEYSGLILNKKVKQCGLVVIGHKPRNPRELYGQKACGKLNFWDRITMINMWSGRNWTMYGRCQIIKTVVASRFLFVSSILKTPVEVIRAVNNLILKFVWRNKKDRIKRSILVKEIDMGGLKVPDFEMTSKQW